MKTLYQFIALLVLYFAGMFLFMYWTENQFLEAKCGHIVRIPAYKYHYVTWNGKNEYGVDKSCYVRYFLNGRWHKSEWWNVGDCNDETPIEINVVDYSCD